MPEDIILKMPRGDADSLFKTSKFLSKHLKNCKVTPNKSSYTILVGGTTKTNVETAMDRYINAYKSGHGRCDINYEILSKEVSERQRLEEEIKRDYEGRLTAEKLRMVELEQKWSKDRDEYKSDITELRGQLKNKNFKLKSEERVNELLRMEVGDKDAEISSLSSDLEQSEQKFDDYVNIPIYKLFWERLKEFVKK